MKPLDEVVGRVRAEYLEMPGMKLTAPQVQRLCGVEPDTCKTVLDAMVNAKFLCVEADGSYARLLDEDVPYQA
jgi:hypothetical protein